MENNQSNTETLKVTRYLAVPLSDEEVAERGIQLNEALRAEEAVRDEYNMVKKEYRDRIADAHGHTQALSDAMTNRAEEREVDCEITKDFTHNSFKAVRLDTGEVIEERALTAEEAQMGLVSEEDAGSEDGPAEMPEDIGDPGNPAYLDPHMRCLNCEHEFMKEGYYDPEKPLACPECKQKQVWSQQVLREREADAAEKAVQGNADPATQ